MQCEKPYEHSSLTIFGFGSGFELEHQRCSLQHTCTQWRALCTVKVPCPWLWRRLQQAPATRHQNRLKSRMTPTQHIPRTGRCMASHRQARHHSHCALLRLCKSGGGSPELATNAGGKRSSVTASSHVPIALSIVMVWLRALNSLILTC